MARILHVLSQRPLLTGSGISLDALVRQAAAMGWQQAVAVGVPVGTEPLVGGLDRERIHPLYFADPGSCGSARPDLDFPVPGMSDVMPYPSSVWSRLTEDQLRDYRRAWRAHLEMIRTGYAPDLVHTNHLWLVSSLVREVFAGIPVVLTCHATGLRQLELCPRLAEEVIAGCRDIDHFCVLREDHRVRLATILDIDSARVTVTGAGYREDLFHPRGHGVRRRGDLLYVGKYSAAKGVPWLLDAVAGLAADRPEVRLHVAGGGSGREAEALARRMDTMAPRIVRHGQLDQEALAGLMRECGVCVLPSFYEGVPLVLVEAAACGCRVVATALPGVTEQLAPVLGDILELVRPPRLEKVDRPVAADLPLFTSDLRAALGRSLDAAATGAPVPDLSRFTWSGVSSRVQDIWRRLLAREPLRADGP